MENFDARTRRVKSKSTVSIMADKPNDLDNEESPSVPAIKLDLVPETKPSGVPEPKVENTANVSTEPRSQNFKFAPSTPLFGSSRPLRFKSFSSVGPKMSGDKPSTSMASSPLRASFLRPPQLASPDKFGSAPEVSENSSKYSFALKPARFSNPFAKASESEETTEEAAVPSSSEEKPAASACETTQPLLSQPKFVPLGTPLPPSQSRATPASPAPAACASTTAAAGFVFGQNLHERVSDAAESSTEKKDVPEAVNTLGSNGSTENLFTSVLKKEQGEKSNDSGGEGGGERPSKSLSEAAKEYEESRAVKRKYDEVAVVTGEEDEFNILQINCKLFAYDKVKSSWVERGRGNLRLNDKESGSGQKHSRVIMRTAGSFRVVLNTKLWPGMVVEKVSTKSVRLTAMDAISGEVLVFLVMASPKDADSLFNYLESRVTSLKASCAENASSHPDASRKNSVCANASENENDSEAKTKKRAGDLAAQGSGRNDNSKSDAESRDSQDTGGSDDSCLGKNSADEDISNSTMS